MFVETEINGLHTILFTLGSSTFTIAPSAGCRLMRWDLATRNGPRAILHWPDEFDPAQISSVRGGNPLLFPFCGRSFHKGMENFWRDPAGTVRPMPRHGFAKNGQFRVRDLKDDALCAELVPDANAQQAYPFSYRFSVTYRFSELACSVSLALENTGEQPIPWSAGHHFYFTLPWHKSARRSDYHLHFDARKAAYHAPDGSLLMQKNDRILCHDLGDPQLSDRIHWELRQHRVSFGPKGGEEDIHILFPTPIHKAHSLVTWSASEDAPFYCVEPWMGPPNAAEHGKGLHWVQPGESHVFPIEISLY